MTAAKTTTASSWTSIILAAAMIAVAHAAPALPSGVDNPPADVTPTTPAALLSTSWAIILSVFHFLGVVLGMVLLYVLIGVLLIAASAAAADICSRLHHVFFGPQASGKRTLRSSSDRMSEGLLIFFIMASLLAYVGALLFLFIKRENSGIYMPDTLADDGTLVVGAGWVKQFDPSATFVALAGGCIVLMLQVGTLVLIVLGCIVLWILRMLIEWTNRGPHGDEEQMQDLVAPPAYSE